MAVAVEDQAVTITEEVVGPEMSTITEEEVEIHLALVIKVTYNSTTVKISVIIPWSVKIQGVKEIRRQI